MHIEFKRLIVHNFMSFGSADVKFNDDGFIRVSGINENPNDNARSNGSGKSSLWEAIVWAITGETIRGTKNIVNINGDNGCVVEVEFYVDRTRYQIIRSKDHDIRKTSLQILINGEDVSGKGIRDSEKLLQQYLPDMTASLLGSVVILGQGLPQKFTNNTPSGRKEVLERLSKSDFMIEDLKKRVSDRKTQLQSELRKLEDSILSRKSELNFIVKQIQENEAILSSLDKDEIQFKISSTKSELDKTVANIETNDQTYDDVCSNLKSTTESLTQLTCEKNSEIETLTTRYNETIYPLLKTKETLTLDLKSTNKELTQLKSIKDVCPTCGQRLPDVHRPDTSALEAEVTNISLRLKEVEETLATHEQDFNHALLKLKDHFGKLSNSLDAESKLLNDRLATLRHQRKELTQKQTELTSILTKEEHCFAQLQVTIDTCNKIIRDNNENIRIAEKEILYNNKQRDLTQSHLEVVNKFETALKRDFRGYLLSTVISFIEERTKYYSSIIFDTKNITFALDGNNIDISYMNKAYENLSGGEKQKIDLIIQFSIRDMLSAQLGFTSNILVLDEVFDGLDSIGCTKVIDMIASVSDIKNIFIVTHRKDLSIPTDKELIVVKSPVGISEIRYDNV